MNDNDGLFASQILDGYSEYGCQINALDVDELFRRYVQHGFLYPAKMRRLEPFMRLVRENWEKALHAGDLIHYVVSAQPTEATWASITAWRSTDLGWHTQHLVGHGPSASRAVMLAASAYRLRHANDISQQNWFQRTNRFANKIFGSIPNTLGGDVGWVGDYSYFGIQLNLCHSADRGVSVRMCETTDHKSIRQLAALARSSVFVVSEGLDGDDLALDAVDELYRKVGLRRYRRVLIAEFNGHSTIAGFALVYRGPLGFSFSFLENRCDLVIDPTLSDIERRSVLCSLLSSATYHYSDFPPQYVPVIVEAKYAKDLLVLGAEHIREYAQSIWLRDGFECWYRHVERLYESAIRAEFRHSLRSAGGARNNTL
jgi:hypothetical protein